MCYVANILVGTKRPSDQGQARFQLKRRQQSRTYDKHCQVGPDTSFLRVLQAADYMLQKEKVICLKCSTNCLRPANLQGTPLLRMN
jgi:hypothetical protein